jgi:hypothetical protein
LSQGRIGGHTTGTILDGIDNTISVSARLGKGLHFCNEFVASVRGTHRQKELIDRSVKILDFPVVLTVA